MSELTVQNGGRSPAEITDPAEVDVEVRRAQAVLDVARRARADLREQVQILVRVVELAYRGVELVDEMRECGELVEAGAASLRRTSAQATLKDVGLNHRRLSEWRSLREYDALAFLNTALKDERDTTLEKASLNWVRKRVERIAREAPPTGPVEDEYVYGDIKIRLGDFREKLGDLKGQVDAIVTDPPYPADFFDEYDALSEVSARVLAPDGVLVAMVGQTHLPTYIARLEQHLLYRWCGAYLTEGPATRIRARKVGTKWKPILVFGASEKFLTQDVFSSEREDKEHHGWGQSESGVADLVERFTDPGALVVDPFLGGGTTAVVCRDLGRRFVGCDLDERAIEKTTKRLDG